MPPHAERSYSFSEPPTHTFSRPQLRRVASARSLAPSDLLPGFEQKFEVTNGQGGSHGSSVLKDGLAFMAYGAQAIAQDEFSKCFTQKPRRHLNIKTIMLGPIYYAGWIFRYFFLFPYRLTLMLLATLFFFALLPVVLYFENEEWQRWLFKFYCGAFLRSWGSQIRYHGQKPKLNTPHVFVSNHTSFIDYLVLSAHDFPHATVAQNHGGIIGYFEHSVLTLNGSLMFNRNEKNDRTKLAMKMRAHVANATSSPILIFPEGTCVNNEYTVLFHKGAFELDAQICPVAIKYDKRWADAYWHTKTQTFTKHLLYLMTRWALVADVWYLPPRAKRPEQSSVDFANDVKAEISEVAGLKNLSWDGYFKNYAPAKEKRQRLQEHPQTRYGAVLMHRLRNRAVPDRMKGLRRSASFHFETEPSVRPIRDDLLATKPDWALDPNQSTNVKNEILMALEDEDRRSFMIGELSDRKSDVVRSWKRYSKMRSTDVDQRRLEYSTWRLWFKKRVDRERRRRGSESGVEEGRDRYGFRSLMTLPGGIFNSGRGVIEEGGLVRRQRSKSAGTEPGFRNRLWGKGKVNPDSLRMTRAELLSSM